MSIERFKNKVRAITKRNRGVSLEAVIKQLNLLIPGWVRYFKLAKCKTRLESLDEWIRRKVRCYKLKKLKRSKTILKMLISRDIKWASARKVAFSGKGWWRLSLAPQVHQAMGVGWTKEIGLRSALGVYLSL